MNVVPFYKLANTLLLVTASIEGEDASNTLHLIGHVQSQVLRQDGGTSLLWFSRVKLKELLRLPRMPDTATRREWQIWEPGVGAKISENTRWRQESKNPGLVEAKWCHPVFFYLQIIHFFCRILRVTWLLAYVMQAISCSNSRMANYASDCATKYMVLLRPIQPSRVLRE